MKSQEIFSEKKELERLDIQHRLLEEYERPVLDEIFRKGGNLSVLDIGSNDGRKTISHFSHASVDKVIGLEYDESLVKEAEREKMDGRFFFYSMDVESESFSSSLARIMEEREIDSFDIIYMSFVLMHLSSPLKLLNILKNYLKKDGKLIVVEVDDSRATLDGVRTPLLNSFLDILSHDKYSGNRTFGKDLEKTLFSAGYDDISIKCDSIEAGKDEKEKRRMIYTVFFSYLEDDVRILLEEEEKTEYREWKKWLEKNMRELEREIKYSDETVAMGMKILTAERKK